MALLTIQVFVVLLMKPFPRFFLTVIWPFLLSRYKKFTLKKYLKVVPETQKDTVKKIETPKSLADFNDFKLFVYASTERKKADFEETIRDEYMEKVLLYGYIMVSEFCLLSLHL